jgi:hypothetical protein
MGFAIAFSKEGANMPDDGMLEKLIDKFPYSDGSLRRRFVSGAIVLISLWVAFNVNLKTIIEGVSIDSIIKSPTILLGIVLLIYAIGNIIEILGEIFLVRAASGTFYAIQFPLHHFRNRNPWMKYSLRILLWVAFVPSLIYYSIFKGLVGFTDFRFDIESRISNHSIRFYKSLPEKVISGLSQPLGDDAEIAWKYLISSFSSEGDKRWARRLITHAKDVLSVTTAFVIVTLLAFAFVNVNPFQNRVSLAKSTISRAVTNCTTTLASSLKPAKGTILKIDEVEKSLDNEIRDLNELTERAVQTFSRIQANSIQVEHMLADVQELTMNFEKCIKRYEDKYRIKAITDDLKSPLSEIENEIKKLREMLGDLKFYEDRVQYAFVLVPFLLMLLYIGFFITIRNSACTIVEVLALKQNEPDKGEQAQ